MSIRRPLLLAALVAGVLASLAHAGPLPELDVTQGMRPSEAIRTRAARTRANAAVLRLASPKSMDERYDVPNLLWADRTPGVRTAFVAGAARPDAASSARRHLGMVQDLYRLRTDDVSEAPVRYVHDTGRGGIIVAFTQQVDGIPVFRDEVKVLMDREHGLIGVSGYIPSRSLVQRAAQGGLSFTLSPDEAIATAYADFAQLGAAPQGLQPRGTAEGGYELHELPGTALSEVEEGLRPGGPVRVRRTLFHQPDALVPAYQLEIMAPERAYMYVIDANTGALLFRHDIMVHEAFSYRVWAEPTAPGRPYDGPQGNAPTPHPTGLADLYSPSFVAPNLITWQNGPISTNDPWLPAGATSSSGNNVDAYADIASPDGFGAGDLRATTTGPNAFDRTYNVNLAPSASTDQRMASITQLFYNNNFLHDWFYDSGFDEASGNGQADNYGRGGLGGDALRAEAQDYGGTNNANMATPPDGTSGRMQMYLFTPAGASSLTATGGVSGTYAVGVATGFGAQSFNTTGTLILGVDATAPVNDGCTALSNSTSVLGKIVLLDRGLCGFSAKALTAQNAGAIGVIIADNASNTNPPGLGGTLAGITIPVLSVTLATGNSLKAGLTAGTVTVTMSRQPSVVRDGSLDNQIVTHEWGHFISNRLVGDAAGLSTSMAGGLGEGWADFHALFMSVNPEDIGVGSNANWNGVYAMAGYALHPSVGSSNAYYFGIRRVPFSTDFTKNALTFRHIENGVALPATVPTAFGLNGANNAEVHNTGEVWCNMLWECYASLLRDNVRLSFAQAQARMKDYLVTAYKLTPNAPTLLEARDALLLAAYANSAQDYQLFWAAFARRGAGVGAIAPDRFSTTNTGVVESYGLGGDLAVVDMDLDTNLNDCDADGYLDEGELGTLTVTVRNTGATMLTQTGMALASTNPRVQFPNGTAFSVPALAPFQSRDVTVVVGIDGSTSAEVADVTASFTDPGFLQAGSRTLTGYRLVNVDEFPSTFETVEALAPLWTNAGSPAEGAWGVYAVEGTANHMFLGPDLGTFSDNSLVSPPLQVAATGSFTFSFQMAHDFEADATNRYDGGVIEISTNNVTWTDLGSALSVPYTGTIYSGTGAGPLAGRVGYTGRSAGFPLLQTVNVSLGTLYAGQTVRVRFRIGCDAGVGAGGWLLDNLSFSNLDNQPFLGLGDDQFVCAPVSVGPPAPHELSFAVDGPNPGRGRTSFRFGLPTAQSVEVAVFDVSGRRVATLADGSRGAGWHTASWSTNDDGSTPQAGLYFARLVTATGTVGSRIIRLP
ncbi:MAG: M36 family metallopeptidase [bacterium]